MDEHDRPASRPHIQLRANWVLIGFLVVAGFYLVTEHRAHLIPYLGYWPLLLVLLCPLMHLFMHGGHGAHSGHQADEESRQRPTDDVDDRIHKA